VGFIIADVSGKGVGAALFMALFQSLLRASAERASRQRNGRAIRDEEILLEAVTSTNDYITRVHGHAHMFASVFFGLLCPDSGAIRYVNAGHEPPIVVGGQGVSGRLSTTGPALGLMSDARFTVGAAVIEPGEILLAFTDGVTEARNTEREFFSDESLMSLVADPCSSAADLLDRIEDSVARFTDGADPFDDLTLLAVRRQT